MSIDLDQLAALEQAATPGPWEWTQFGAGASSIGKASTGDFWDDPVVAVNVSNPSDAALIAEMRNALPELIERVRGAEDHADAISGGALIEDAEHFVERINLRVELDMARAAVISADHLDRSWTELWAERDLLRTRADAAEARVANLEAGIKAILAEHWDWKAGRSLYDRVAALLNGTDKDSA